MEDYGSSVSVQFSEKYGKPLLTLKYVLNQVHEHQALT